MYSIRRGQIGVENQTARHFGLADNGHSVRSVSGRCRHFTNNRIAVV